MFLRLGIAAIYIEQLTVKKNQLTEILLLSAIFKKAGIIYIYEIAGNKK